MNCVLWWPTLISKTATHGLRHARLCAMLLVCMVGQPMAFSMHPFDVDSWAKNGDDAQLESVLGLVAQVSEQDPKELAEDVRSMSGPVRNRMHDYPGTSLLEAWEAEALTHEDFTPTPKHPHIFGSSEHVLCWGWGWDLFGKALCLIRMNLTPNVFLTF